MTHAQHGSTALDAAVPSLLGPHPAPADSLPVRTVDIAPTLAALLA
jgi:hypothetical protein